MEGQGLLLTACLISVPVGHYLVETDLAGVALGEGVGGDQACLTTPVKQRVSSEQEVGDQVGAAAYSMAY